MAQVGEITEHLRFAETVWAAGRLRVVRAIDRRRGDELTCEMVAPPPGADERLAEGFLAAAALLAVLEHPAMPEIRDSGVTADGELFLVTPRQPSRPLEAAAGDPPGQVVALLLEAVEALELLELHGFPHGELSGETLRIVDVEGRPACRLVGLTAGAVLAAAGGAELNAALAADRRALAELACRLLGLTLDGSTGRRRVELPLALSFELEDAEALRLALERALAATPGRCPPYAELRLGLERALYGDPGEATAGGTAEVPPARLVFSTEPPELPPAAAAAAAAAVAAVGGGGADEIDDATLALSRSAEDTAAAWVDEGTAVRGPDDTAVPPPAGGVRREITRVVVMPPPAAEDVLPPLAPWLSTAAAETATAAAESTESAELRPPGSPLPPPGELLAAVDATLAPSLPRPRSPEEPVRPGAGSAAAAAPRAHPGAAPARGVAPHRRRALVLGAGGALVLVALLLAAVVLLRRSAVETAAPPAVPSPAGTAARPTAEGPVDPRLVAALAHLGSGDDRAAAAALAALDPEAMAAFSPRECELVALIERTVAAADQQRLAAGLERGLVEGDLGLLRRVLAGAAASGPAFASRYPELRGVLRQAQRMVSLDDRARRALADGEPLQAIEYAGTLLDLFPGSEEAVEVRDSAARELEREAETLAAGGELEAALDRLAGLDRAWPDRPGLLARIEGYRELLRTRQDFEALLEAARDAGRRGRPDEGMALLAGVTPDDRLAAPYAAARSALERQLAELDARPPQIAFAAGSVEEIVKNEPARVALRVSDDYKVASVEVYARPKDGGSWRRLDHRWSGGEVVVVVPAELHDNRALELYAVATDLSGHRAGLGTADDPVEIKRRRWFHRLRGD